MNRSDRNNAVLRLAEVTSGDGIANMSRPMDAFNGSALQHDSRLTDWPTLSCEATEFPPTASDKTNWELTGLCAFLFLMGLACGLLFAAVSR